MSDSVLLATLVVLVVSYLLVLVAAKNRRSPFVDEYLYGGNRPLFAVSSGLGTVLSMSIAFTALLSGGYVFGWQILFSLVPGAVTGLTVLLRISHSFVLRQAAERPSRTENTTHRRPTTSYLSFLANSRQPAAVMSLFGIPILIYAFLMMMEFSVVRVTIQKLLHLEVSGTTILLTLIAGVCFFYVFVGGYLGVLLTDHFQLLVIGAFLAIVPLQLGTGIVSSGIPSPFSSQLEWPSVSYILLLHLGCFISSMSIVLASPDNWIRTIGTLRLSSARVVLVVVTITTCTAAAIPILIGASFHQSGHVSAGLGGELSIHLLRQALSKGNVTLTILFTMAVVCVIMTTIDTYMITIQQLYYELVSHLRASNHRIYLLEYCLKWKQLRTVGFVEIVIALLASLLVSARSIYVFGVGSLSLVILLAPLPPMLLSRIHEKQPRIVQASASGLAASFLLSPVLMWTTHKFLAPVDSHLYLLTVATTAATVLGYGGSILLALHRVDRPRGKADR